MPQPSTLPSAERQPEAVASTGSGQPAPAVQAVPTTGPLVIAGVAPAVASTAGAARPLRPASGAQPSASGAVAQLQAPLVSVARGGAVTVHLNPVELGRIDVRVAHEPAGGIRVTLTAERDETLAALVRDRPQIEAALDHAGISTERRTLEFAAVPATTADTASPPPRHAPVQSLADPGSQLPGGAGSGSGGASGHGHGSQAPARRSTAADGRDQAGFEEGSQPTHPPTRLSAPRGIDITA